MTDQLDQLRAALAGSYTVEREIGRGGMATVYLAVDVKHERKVAIKVLDPDLSAAVGRDRFLREIKTTAQLSNPHILPLLDSGYTDDALYYVMPFVEGESLEARLAREKQLPLAEAISIACNVASALHYAHAHGVVHRDIKPANIMLCDGEAIVMDFGIARAVSAAGGEKLTNTGIAIGTPMYMSPEQSTGESDVDARSDIYSLGTVVFEMLAGESPFAGPTAQAIIAKRLTTDVPRLSLLREIPEHVERAVRKSLARVPADRWTTAAEFAEALRGERVITQSYPAATLQSAHDIGAHHTADPAPLPRSASPGRGAGRRTMLATATIVVLVIAGVILVRAKSREGARATPPSVPSAPARPGGMVLVPARHTPSSEEHVRRVFPPAR